MNRQLAKTIGQAARAARKAQKLTQEDAAERVGVSVEFYARIERGISLPSIATFAGIVSALGVSADALLGRQPIALPATPPTSWMPPREEDPPEIRRILRRLRKARSSTLRLVSMLVRTLENPTESNSEVYSNPGNGHEHELCGQMAAMSDPGVG